MCSPRCVPTLCLQGACGHTHLPVLQAAYADALVRYGSTPTHLPAIISAAATSVLWCCSTLLQHDHEAAQRLMQQAHAVISQVHAAMSNYNRDCHLLELMVQLLCSQQQQRDDQVLPEQQAQQQLQPDDATPGWGLLLT